MCFVVFKSVTLSVWVFASFLGELSGGRCQIKFDEYCCLTSLLLPGIMTCVIDRWSDVWLRKDARTAVSGCVSCVLFRPTPMSCSAVVGVPSERSMYWPRALDAVACYHRRGPLPDSLHNARLVSPKVLTRSSISCCIWTSCHVLQILFAKNRNMWYYDNISCQQILFTSMRYFSILLWYEIARINISLG